MIPMQDFNIKPNNENHGFYDVLPNSSNVHYSHVITDCDKN